LLLLLLLLLLSMHRIRFGKGSDGITATTSGMNRPVHVQSTWMRSRVGPQYLMR
jgi:hypothetical protein